MSASSFLPPQPEGVPFDLWTLATVLSDRRRWKILYELSKGEPLMVKEVAEILGEKPANISNHLKVLLSAGIVRVGSGRLYHLQDQFKKLLGQGVIDLGFCVVRLNWVADAKID